MVSQGKKHTDKHLREVARVYNRADKSRVPVQQAVATHFGISISTATKQIMSARSRGFIADAELTLLFRKINKASRELKKLQAML